MPMCSLGTCCEVTTGMESLTNSGLEIASMYLEQAPANDIGRSEAATAWHPPRTNGARSDHYQRIRGVALIGEHGEYPNNDKGSKTLSPLRADGEDRASLPWNRTTLCRLFVDKHFSTEWKKAKQMYDWSRELRFPLIAGTSLTLTWRRPELELDLESPIQRAVGYFYGGKEAYGYHGVEVFQSMVERRKGGETGLNWVQCLEGKEVWKWSDANPWARNLLEEAMRHDDSLKRGRVEDNVNQPLLFLLGYRSGLLGVMYMLTGQTQQAGFAAEIEGQSQPAVCSF